MFTPEKRTLSFRLNKSVSGSPVRALPEVKCIIAWACRYASKFNAKKPAMNAAPTTSNQRLILFFKSASLVDTNYREFPTTDNIRWTQMSGKTKGVLTAEGTANHADRLR